MGGRLKQVCEQTRELSLGNISSPPTSRSEYVIWEQMWNPPGEYQLAVIFKGIKEAISGHLFWVIQTKSPTEDK